MLYIHDAEALVSLLVVTNVFLSHVSTLMLSLTLVTTCLLVSACDKCEAICSLIHELVDFAG